MIELFDEDLRLINGGSEESYESGKAIGEWIGKVAKAVGYIIDSLSPAS